MNDVEEWIKSQSKINSIRLKLDEAFGDWKNHQEERWKHQDRVNLILLLALIFISSFLFHIAGKVK
jgi:hypothetical protein